jgi:hypothetical protein
MEASVATAEPETAAPDEHQPSEGTRVGQLHSPVEAGACPRDGIATSIRFSSGFDEAAEAAGIAPDERDRA